MNCNEQIYMRDNVKKGNLKSITIGIRNFLNGVKDLNSLEVDINLR